MQPRRGRGPWEQGAPPSHPGPGGSQAPAGGSERAGDGAPLLLPRDNLPRRRFVSRSSLIHRTVRMVPTAGSRARSASVRAGASRLPRRANFPHACSLSTIRIRTGSDQFTKLTQMTRVDPGTGSSHCAGRSGALPAAPDPCPETAGTADSVRGAPDSGGRRNTRCRAGFNGGGAGLQCPSIGPVASDHQKTLPDLV